MDDLSRGLLTLGLLFLLGLSTDALGRHTPLPRVTLLLIFGFLIGPSALSLLPEFSQSWFPVIADMALLMVGFLLGEKLTFSFLRQNGRAVLLICLGVVVATVVVMVPGLCLIGVPIDVALLLAGIATATAPAATSDVVREARADGKFTRTLLGIVAIDDAIGLIFFSLMLAIAHTMKGHGGASEILLYSSLEIGGAVLVGIVLGIPMAYLTGRIRPGEPTLAEALGMVFLCGGIAIWLDVSFLLASMVMGGVVANLARHHQRPFHAIENIEWPFMILFFVLAGASLNLGSLSRIGIIGAAYVIFRIVGRLAGAWTGGTISHVDPLLNRWMGAALMPHAGVALGMALVATQRFPDLADTILPIVIGATVLFELIGPVLTRKALVRVGEVHLRYEHQD
jgi:Kef-type K+ transport system membrane component KefB